MGITISTIHSYYTGEFEEPTTLDVYNNTKYALVLQKFHCNRGEILSNRGEPVDRVHARQGIAKTIVRMRGDRTGEEQQIWLKSKNPLTIHVTMCYALMDKGADSGIKLTLKLFLEENGEPRVHARLTEHHSAEITINQIMDEYTDDSGSKTVYGIDFVWGGGRPAFVRMERIMPPAAPDTSAADKGTVT